MPHIHEKIDWCVEVFIVYQNKVLLRVHDKVGIWLSVGGHVELHEDPTEAAQREVKEEVGLEIELFDNRPTFTEGEPAPNNYRSLIAPAFLARHRVNETHEHVVMVYFAKAKDDVVTPEKPTDIYRWFTEEELTDPQYKIVDNVIFYDKQALEKLGD